LPPELESRLQAIYDKHEFDAKRFGPAKWLDHGAANYTLLEAAPGGQGQRPRALRHRQRQNVKYWCPLHS